MVKNPPANAGDADDMSLIPESGRSPGGGTLEDKVLTTGPSAKSSPDV